MRYGLKEHTIESICGVLARHPAVEKAVLYGSRAKGNYKHGSDIDLTLCGDALSYKELGAIIEELDDLLLPYKIDLSIFEQLDNVKLREHIERVGVVFYQRTSVNESKDAGVKAGWTTKPLSEVCQIKPPKAEVRRLLSVTDLVSFVPMENLGIEQKTFVPTQVRPLEEVSGSYTYFADGDVLLAKITPCFENGKLGIATNLTNGIGFGSSEYIVFRPDKSLDKEWLYYFLSQESFRIEGADRMSGAVGHKRVSKEFIESYPIPVPPLPEQQRIVAILDEAFDGIAAAKANAEKNLQNARALFESHLNEVFTKRGEGWVEKTLGDIAQIKGGKRVPKGYKLLTEPTGFPYLRVTDFTDTGTIDMSDLHYVSPDVHQVIKNYVIYSNDLYISIAGTIGKSGIIPEELNGANLTENACRLVFKPGISNRFVYYFTLTANFVDQTGLNTRTAAQPKLALSRLSTTRLGIPSISEQEHLADRFDALREETQRLESIYQQKLAALDALKKSLLDQAFSGAL
ncbi:MAG: restriction endonuclease subunit S [Geobacteraceae bacterium]